MGTYSLLQTAAQASLANSEVAMLVQQLARKQHSSALAQLASRIAAVAKYGSAAGDDPFAKIKGLITDMIEKLQKRQGRKPIVMKRWPKLKVRRVSLMTLLRN